MGFLVIGCFFKGESNTNISQHPSFSLLTFPWCSNLLQLCLTGWTLLTQFELAEKATKHFGVYEFCEVSVTTPRASSAYQSLLLLNMFWALKKVKSFCPQGKKLSGCIRKWNSNKRSHLIKGTHLPRNSKNQKQEDSNIKDAAHFN